MIADIGLTATRDLPEVGGVITGAALVLQRAETRLRTFQGEAPMDESLGMPYFVWIDTKPPPVPTIVGKARSELEGIPGVTALSGRRMKTCSLMQHFRCGKPSRKNDFRPMWAPSLYNRTSPLLTYPRRMFL